MIKFKTDRQKSEYESLSIYNKRLRDVLDMVALYARVEFDKDITVTDLFRTQAEFDSLYAETPVDKRPSTSPHLTQEAADLRSSDFTDNERNKILKLLSAVTYRDGKPSALVHQITGNALHFHIQVRK